MSLYNALGDPHQANQNWSHATGFSQSSYNTNSTSVKEQPSSSTQPQSHILSSLLSAPSSSERYVPSQFQETQAAKKEEDGLPLDEPGMVIGREEVILPDNSHVVASGYHHTSAIPNQQISSSHTHSTNIHKTGQAPFLQGPAGLSTPQEFAGQPSQSVGSYGHDSYNSASHSQIQGLQSSYVLPQNVNQQSHGPLQQNQNLGQQQGLGQQTFSLQQHNHLQGQTQSHTQMQAVNQLPQHNQPGQQQAMMQHPLSQPQPLQQMANHQHYLGNQMNPVISQAMGASQLTMGQPNQQLGGSPGLLTQTVGQRPGVSQHPLSQQQVANHQSSLCQLPVVQLSHVNYNILQRPLTLDDIINEVPSSGHSVPLSGNNMHLLNAKNAYTVNRHQQVQQPMQLLIHRLPSSLATGQRLQNQQYLQNQMVVPNQQGLQGQRSKNSLSFSLLPHNARLQFQNQQPVHSQQSMPRQLSLPNHQSLQTQQTLQHQANFQNQHSVQSPATPHIEVGNQHQSFDSGAGYTGQLHGQATGVEQQQQQQQQVACSQQQVKVKQEQAGMMFVAHPNTSVLGSPYISSHHNSQHLQPQHLPQNVIQTSLGSPLAATLPNSPQLNTQTPSQCAMNSSPQLSVQQKSPQLSLQSSPQMSLQSSPQQLSLQGSPNTHQNSAQMMMMPSAQSKQQLSHQDAGQMGNLPQLNSTSQAQTPQQAVQVQSVNQASHNQNTPHTVQLSGNVLSQRPFQVSQQAEGNQQGRNQFTGQNSDASVPSSGRGRGRGSRGGRGRGRGRGNTNSTTGLHMAPDHFRPDLRFPVAVESAASNIEPVVSHAESSMAIQEPGLKDLSAMPVPKSEPGNTALLQGSQLPCLNRYSPPSITYGTNETWPTPLPPIKQENCGSPPALIVNSAPQSSQLSSISPALSPASYLDDIKVSPPVLAPVLIPSATEVVPSPSQTQPAKPVVPEATEEKPQPKPAPVKRKLAENEEGTAVCKYCGYCSSNLETCEGCRRVLPADVKLMIKKKKTENSEPGDERERTCGGGKVNSSPSIAGPSGNKRGLYGNKMQNQGAALMGTNYSPSGNLAGQSVGRGGYSRRRGSGTGRGGSRARKLKEPVTVTISSDEDEDPSSDTSQRMSFSTVAPNAAAPDEEEGFFPSSSSRPEAFGTGRRERMQEALGKYAGEGIYFKVRGVRIGSMRTSGIEVRFRDQNITFKVTGETSQQELQFALFPTDLTLIKFFLRLPQPVIFIKVTPECAQRLRDMLKMTLDTPETFDPTCQDDRKNMIVVIIEVVYNEPGLVKVMKGYNQVQNLSDLLQELDFDTSNDLLVKSSPVVLAGDPNQKSYPKFRNPMSAQPVNDKGDYNTGEENSPASMGGDGTTDGGDNNNMNHQDGQASHSPSPPRQGFVGPVEKLLIYPPLPTKGAITITNEDLFCLNESEFLNDVILDFYLKYLFREKLSEVDQARTHIFSSFFYKRLTLREPNSAPEKLSPAQRRHSRVKTWTRHVDIFEKDFLLIPINEKSHWILAVVCFPGMVAQEQYNYQVASPTTTSEEVGQSGDAPSTSKQLKTQGSAEEEESQDSLPEATATSAKSEATSALGRVLSAEQVKKEKSVVNVGLKQACILVMDSLSGAPRTNIIRLLKDYLQVEWDLKKTPERDMLKTVRGCCPKVPQQNNYSDCGLFVLQYAESFFESPIANFSIPMKLKDWFPLSKVERKREDIRSLILRLQSESSR